MHARTQADQSLAVSMQPVLAVVTLAIVSALVGCTVGEELQLEEPTIFLAALEHNASSEEVAFAIETIGARQDRFYPQLGIVRLSATSMEAASVADLPFIIAVEPADGIDGERDELPAAKAAFRASGQNQSWGVEAVGGPRPSSERALWVFDSGVDLEHPDLNIDQERSTDMVVLLGGDEFHDPNHATAVAGVAAAIDNDIGTVGVTPGALVVSIRVLDIAGRGRLDTLVAGLNYAAERANPEDVFNLSLAARGNSEVLATAIKRVADKRISVVIAAGNAGLDASDYTPASLEYPGVYTVSATDESGCLAEFSNFGAPIDLGAPGKNIVTLAPQGGSVVFDGTSFAAPHVSGLLLADDLSSDGSICGDRDGFPEPLAHR